MRLALLLGVLFVLFVAFYNFFAAPHLPPIPYDALKNAIGRGDVTRIDIQDNGKRCRARVELKNGEAFIGGPWELDACKSLEAKGLPIAWHPSAETMEK